MQGGWLKEQYKADQHQCYWPQLQAGHWLGHGSNLIDCHLVLRHLLDALLCDKTASRLILHSASKMYPRGTVSFCLCVLLVASLILHYFSLITPLSQINESVKTCASCYGFSNHPVLSVNTYCFLLRAAFRNLC